MIAYSLQKTTLREVATQEVIKELSSVPVLTAKFSSDNTCVLLVTQPQGIAQNNTVSVYRITTNEMLFECAGIDRAANPDSYNLIEGSEYLVYVNDNRMYKHNLMRRKDCNADSPYNLLAYNMYDKTWVGVNKTWGLFTAVDGYPVLNKKIRTEIPADEKKAIGVSFSPKTGKYWILNVPTPADRLQVRTVLRHKLQTIAELDVVCRNTSGSPADNCPFVQNTRPLCSVFSPTGKYLLTYPSNGAVKLWYFDKETVTREMQLATGN